MLFSDFPSRTCWHDMSNPDLEEARIREVYCRRDESGKPQLYSWRREETHYVRYVMNCTWSRAFKLMDVQELGSLEILDVGCGKGEWLRMLLEWGASPEKLHGIDLLQDRIDRGRAISPPLMDLRLGSGYRLPYDDCSMDVTAASTVFSSILSPDARLALAQEIARVAALNGWVIIYDYVVSDPRNPDTIGIGKKEIRRLYPTCTLLHSFSCILIPPLLRILSPRLLWLAQTLESLLPFLRTHRLHVLRKEQAGRQQTSQSDRCHIGRV